MSSNNTSSGTTIKVSISTIVLIVFVILKLTHLIDWPWIWVLAPLWIPIALVFCVFIIIIIITKLMKWINNL